MLNGHLSRINKSLNAKSSSFPAEVSLEVVGFFFTTIPFIMTGTLLTSCGKNDALATHTHTPPPTHTPPSELLQ
jgi:hypothetical protein